LQLATAEKVDVEVGNRFAAVGAVVDGDAVAAFRDAEVGGDLPGSEKEMA